MASSSYYYSPYYYQLAPNYYNHSPQQRAWSVSGFLFLATLSLLVATMLIVVCESAVETLIHQLRGFLILSPVVVLIAVKLWVAAGGGFAELVTCDQGEQYHYGYGYRHRGHGGEGSSSPWGVALALVLVLFLVARQS
jgi:MYXO-CTERM domain-containing protein